MSGTRPVLRRVVLFDGLGERFATALVRLPGPAELRLADRASRRRADEGEGLLAWQRELVRRCTIRVQLERPVRDPRVRAGLCALAAGQILHVLTDRRRGRLLPFSTTDRRRRQWQLVRNLRALVSGASVSADAMRARQGRARGRRRLHTRPAGRGARAPTSSEDSDTDDPAGQRVSPARGRTGSPRVAAPYGVTPAVRGRGSYRRWWR